MPLTYDQKSEIRIAFDEAYIPPERRRDLRIRDHISAKICAWTPKKTGNPFPISIEDFSPTGVGVIHREPMKVGELYLLNVPRRGHQDLVVQLSVARCRPLPDGTFQIGMELSSVMDRDGSAFVDALQARKRHTTRRTKILLLLMAIYGLGISLLVH
jgi:hypothetical protein